MAHLKVDRRGLVWASHRRADGLTACNGVTGLDVERTEPGKQTVATILMVDDDCPTALRELSGFCNDTVIGGKHRGANLALQLDALSRHRQPSLGIDVWPKSADHRPWHRTNDPGLIVGLSPASNIVPAILNRLEDLTLLGAFLR